VSRWALNAKILQLRADQSSKPLKELTDFGWDAVYTYFEGVLPADVNADLGRPVFESGDLSLVNETLIVFANAGTPLKALTLVPLDYDPGRHSADVVVGRGLRLVEPADLN
jgi:hypothetical protein